MGSFSSKKKRQNPPERNKVPEEKPSFPTDSSAKEADEIPMTFGQKGKRVALLVTAPVSESFQNIVEAIGGKVPPSPPVDWDSRDSDALPNLTSRLKFTTHYALCVIDSERWDDTSLTLKQRFTGAKFWDHPGDSTKLASSRSSASNSSSEPTELNACVVWDIGLIKEIDSRQEIGRTDMSDEEISEGR
ncbi:uncharacterized protein LDX57_002515 [Aspergillus melleus]|uniref:uncharacterized protein n=1 Tax=Aspergillus melleus TaxID=138277 RepID=UPI001E8D2C7F|nr:uncharacterized protein LDX57_002515 [Aspergillus melleus]KAH8424772.1 hypothetical protein LDX57_002515 [Aspergillus melleus]